MSILAVHPPAELFAYAWPFALAGLWFFVKYLITKRDKTITVIFNELKDARKKTAALEITMLKEYVREGSFEKAFKSLHEDFQGLEAKVDQKFDKIMLKLGS